MNRRDVLRAGTAAAAGGLLLPSIAGAEASRPRLSVRRAGERGKANHGWLDTRFTFSFAGYQDRKWMGFRSLRVINEDYIAAGRGFPMHPHRDMEIVTYVMKGALQHRDSLGNGGVIRPGEVQRMSAGRGIRHSEFNPLRNEKVHLFQIWMLPERNGIAPSYEQKRFPFEGRKGKLQLVASPTAADGAVRIHTNTNLYASILTPGQRVVHQNKRNVWLQMARGTLDVNGVKIQAGDGLFTRDAGALNIRAASEAEFLLFDLS